MIQPGPGRIQRLLEHVHFPWRAVHVAGTNGKGSVCAYTASMLQTSGLRCGVFTSPHLLDRWDCIKIANKVVGKDEFLHYENDVERTNVRDGLNATSFELLTATAFKLFTKHQVDVAVVEVGLGGRLDATNILESPFASVITKIGMDHEKFLGSSLEEVAAHKGGIMKPGVPCFADATNHERVKAVLSRCATEIGAQAIEFVELSDLAKIMPQAVQRAIDSTAKMEHQKMHATLAYRASFEVLHQLKLPMNTDRIVHAIQNTEWPGRLQKLNLHRLVPQQGPILLDGAHNAQSAKVLREYVNHNLRTSGQSITWVLAFSAGKQISDIMKDLLQTGDAVIATEFTKPEGMSWVAAENAELLTKIANGLKLSKVVHDHRSIELVLEKAVKDADGQPIVIAGSLYLVSDVLRWIRRNQRLV